MAPKKQIATVEEFIEATGKDSTGWPYVWFRGEPGNVSTPLVPRLYRPRPDGVHHNENNLIQTFRMRAPNFGPHCPSREETDQWLFLAQHVGLPTRLLDWTEGALIGLHFAVRDARPSPVVWMLNPIELNRASITPGLSKGESLVLTWIDPKGETRNIGFENIAGAWEGDRRGTKIPVAIPAGAYIHPRMSVQRSCFTI